MKIFNTIGYNYSELSEDAKEDEEMEEFCNANEYYFTETGAII